MQCLFLHLCYHLCAFLGSCPSGAAWAAKAYRNDTAHQLVECSNAGKCNTASGKCECFQGFSGAACQRSACPSGCNNRGICLSMRDMSIYHGRDYDPKEASSGDGTGVEYSNWDGDAIMMCRCDPPYFGPDCSLSKCGVAISTCKTLVFISLYHTAHCPKGDDPLTLDQTLYYFTIQVYSGFGLSGTLRVNFQDEITIFQLDAPSSRQCVAALEGSGKFKSVACVFLEISPNFYQYNVTVLEWPLSPKENNLYSHSGNPPLTDFTCDASSAAAPLKCVFTTTDSDSVKGN